MAIKRETLERWSELEARRSALQRESATVRDEMSQIEKQLEAELDKSGKSSVKRHGFTLAFVPGRASVSWAAEYLAACGAEAVQRLKDAAAANARRVLAITPPSE